jgi:phosphoserine phosphatase
MSHVATLISDPARPAVTDAAVQAARAILPEPGAPAMLARSIAVDIPFGGGSNPLALAGRVRKELGDAPIDVVVQPLADRKKRLFLTDMDSTVIEQECIDELADYVGLKPRVAAITERAMRGEIEFEPALRERVQLLRGLPAAVIDEVIQNRVTLMPGGRTLVATMRANGAHTCLVSGGFTLFTEKIAAMLGFDEQRANRLVIEDGRLVGRVEEPILGREAKRNTLAQLMQRLKLRREQTLVAGDGANDVPMIEAAGLGVAYRARPIVAAVAHARIDHGDLTALLYLQGYRREEFVEI